MLLTKLLPFLLETNQAALAHLESIIQYPEGFQANGVDHVESEEEGSRPSNTNI